MKNIRPDFEVWEKDISELPPGYQKITCHMIFVVKMGENFRIKARFLAYGYKTKTTAVITYSPVVSRESVRIALTIAALNYLDVLACDIQNAYLTADCRVQLWVLAGPNFGSEAGNKILVRKALYILKRSGIVFSSNGGVFVNTARPGLTLSKKNHVIAYHCAQEVFAAVTVRVSK